MGEKMICLCREINKETGEIAVYPIKTEVTDQLLFALGIRQRAAEADDNAETDMKERTKDNDRK